MTMLLDDTTPAASRAATGAGPTAPITPTGPVRPRAAAPLARRRTLPTAALLRLADDTDGALDLVPTGIALHVFTEPSREHARLSDVELHRVTTVLTKQVKRLLTGDDPLAAIATLVTDPGRQAAPDGRTAAMLCGRAWPAVVEIAHARSAASIEGADAFGETAILRLAATRAAAPSHRWWGTSGWVELIDRWAADEPHSRRLVNSLLRTPELVADEILESLLDR
jgi:hypothetical protein